MDGFVLLIIVVALFFVQRSELNKIRNRLEQQIQQLRTQLTTLQQLQTSKDTQPPPLERPVEDPAQRIAEMVPPFAMESGAPDHVDLNFESEPAAAVAATVETAPDVIASAAAQIVVDEKSPSVTSSIGRSIVAWFKGGNTIVRLAVVIIFIGVAFLLRYAAENALLPIEFRLAAVAIGALALAGFGWRVRKTRYGYGISLQGAGIGVLYLTVFAALRLYGLIPPALAFPLLIALATFTALLALLQDALALAVFGFTGAFLAPVLASTGSGSHVALFSYFLIINLAIAWIAQQRVWKLLNLVGFFFTFTIGIAWGLRSWQPELLWSTEPFLIAHVMLYLWITVGYGKQLALLEPPRLPYVDGTLVFGTPIVAFGLQAAMMKTIPFGLALSAAVMSGAYLWLGLRLWRRMGEQMRLLTEGMLALGIVFLFLIAPLALDARWTSAAWALQGAGVTWIAVRQQRTWALLMGLLMQFGAAVAFYHHAWPLAVENVFLNARYFGVIILALAALFSARTLEFAARKTPALSPANTDLLQAQWTSSFLRGAHWLMLLAGLLWWLLGTWQEIRFAEWPVDRAHRFTGMLLIAAALLEAIHRRLRWPQLAIPARPLLIAACMTAVCAMLAHTLFYRSVWSYAWPHGVIEFVALTALAIVLLWRVDTVISSDTFISSDTSTSIDTSASIDTSTSISTSASINTSASNGMPRGTLAIEHWSAAWFALVQTALLAYVFAGHFIARHEAWTPVALIAPSTLLALFALKRLRSAQWPAVQHPRTWLRGVNVLWMLLLIIWMLAVNLFADGSMAPLPYLPLLNPIDLGHALIAIFALSLLHTARAVGMRTPRWLPVLLAISAFWWLNSALLRTLHHWSGTPLWLDNALQFDLVQTSLSILWTLTALATMFIATRRATVSQYSSRWRLAWMLGAALLGAVIVKLIAVDMSHSETLERIVSFLGVGVLMLVIGYVSPLPPARADTKSEDPRSEHAKSQEPQSA